MGRNAPRRRPLAASIASLWLDTTPYRAGKFNPNAKTPEKQSPALIVIIAHPAGDRAQIAALRSAALGERGRP